MPTYQYACTACEDRVDVVQKFTDDPLTVCEVCGGRLRKLFSPVGIVFKGSGFYHTDSRNGAVLNGGKSTKQLDGAAKDSAAAGEKSAGGDSPTPSGEKKAGKAGTAGAGKSSKADAKVA